MKKCLAGLTVFLCCILMIGCQSKPVYADDVSAQTVAHAAVDAIGSIDDYMDGTSNYYSYYFENEQAAALVDDCRLMFHKVETNVNELGVFRVANGGDTAAVEQMVQNYLEEQTEYLRSFAKNYSPEDMTKIDNADVKVMGCYVICYILTPEDEVTMLNAVRQVLAVTS